MNAIPAYALWAFAGTLLILFTIIAIANAIYLVGQIRSRFLYGPSLIPFVGGVFGVIAILIIPSGIVQERLIWCGLPLLIDAGSLPYVVLGIYFSRR